MCIHIYTCKKHTKDEMNKKRRNRIIKSKKKSVAKFSELRIWVCIENFFSFLTSSSFFHLFTCFLLAAFYLKLILHVMKFHTNYFIHSFIQLVNLLSCMYMNLLIHSFTNSLMLLLANFSFAKKSFRIAQICLLLLLVKTVVLSHCHTCSWEHVVEYQGKRKKIQMTDPNSIYSKILVLGWKKDEKNFKGCR